MDSTAFNQHLSLFISIVLFFLFKLSDANSTAFDADQYRTQPLAVNISMHILHVYDVDEASGTLRVVMYFRMRWRKQDWFEIPESTTEAGTDEEKSPSYVPDLFFSNAVSGEILDVLNRNSAERKLPDGSVLTSSKVATTLACKMRFRSFPFDAQKCPLAIESYFRRSDELQLSWDEEKYVTLGEESASIPRFSVSLSNITTQEIQNFSSASVTLILQRKLSSYVSTFYLPSILYVMLPWITFYVAHSKIALKLAVNFFSLAMLQFLSMYVHRNLPPVDCVRASDAWIWLCSAMVVLALAENVFMHLSHKWNSYGYQPTEKEGDKTSQFDVEDGPNHKASFYESESHKIFCLFRWLYPVVAMVTIGIYFIVLST